MAIQKLAQKVLRLKVTDMRKGGVKYKQKFGQIEKREKEIKEIVDRIEKVYEGWKEIVRRFPKEIANFFSYKVLPEIEKIKPQDLEKILNQLIEKYNDKEYSPVTFGLLLSLLINRTVDEYVKVEMQKGKKINEIKPLNIVLDLERVKKPPCLIGYENRDKSYLTIMGNLGHWVGYFMKGGKLIIKGRVKSFGLSAFCQSNKGEIWYKGKRIWPKAS